MSARAASDNLLRPFQLERSMLKGRVVRLGAVIDQVLTRHDYPEPVSQLLGELFVLAATLAGALKFDGTFSLQTRSGGPVSLMVADCTNDGAMRGYAELDRNRVAEAGTEAGVSGLLGAGHLAITVDQNRLGQAYQGIVELSGTTLTECMQSYFRQSEQLRTGLRVAVDRVAGHGERRWRAGGIMVQQLPEESAAGPNGEQAEEDWRRTMILLGTATDAELTDPFLPPEHLLLRLFHEEGVRVFRPLDLSFGCRCSRERVETMLRSFPRERFEEMKQEDGELVVTCQFCNASYRFDDPALDRLHAPVVH
ncbi:MAG: Hsp33 family molecular chaperone HslO [Geminicoccaceae bacterium]